jgi:hypothetical protein
MRDGKRAAEPTDNHICTKAAQEYKGVTQHMMHVVAEP